MTIEKIIANKSNFLKNHEQAELLAIHRCDKAFFSNLACREKKNNAVAKKESLRTRDRTYICIYMYKAND